MIRFKLTHVVTDEQIVDLFKIYIYQVKGKYTKKSFVTYVKDQVGMFGTDEFLTSTDMDMYESLKKEHIDALIKWKLID